MEICDVPGELILFGSIGALLLSSYLNKNGHSKAGSILESLAVPIIGIGLAKYKGVIKSQIESAAGTEQEPVVSQSDTY